MADTAGHPVEDNKGGVPDGSATDAGDGGGETKSSSTIDGTDPTSTSTSTSTASSSAVASSSASDATSASDSTSSPASEPASDPAALAAAALAAEAAEAAKDAAKAVAKRKWASRSKHVFILSHSGKVRAWRPGNLLSVLGSQTGVNHPPCAAAQHECRALHSAIHTPLPPVLTSPSCTTNYHSLRSYPSLTRFPAVCRPTHAHPTLSLHSLPCLNSLRSLHLALYLAL